MRLNVIIKLLEERFPLFCAEDWDNVGLIVGRRDKIITGIVIALDITEKVIEETIKTGSNLIITHHPIIFNPLKKINEDSVLGKKILKLIENNISVYTLHTNLDSAKMGLNDYLGDMLGFKDGEILVLNEKNGCEFGIGRVYKVKNEFDIENLCSDLKSKLKLKKISLVKSMKDIKIKKIALISGSGSSYWREAKKRGCQLLITGDVTYHDAMDIRENNFNIIDIGHFESEHIFTELLKKIILEECGIKSIVCNDGPIFECR